MPQIPVSFGTQFYKSISSVSMIRQRFVAFVQKLAKENSTPASIALGVAIGSFIAILPTPGFGAFLAISLTLFFKGINRLAVVVAVTIWNPLLLVPLYYLSYLLGSILSANPIVIANELSLHEMLFQYTGAFLLGNIIFAVSIALVSYVGVYRLMTDYYRRQRIHQLMALYQAKPPKTA